jgi:uncharacterized protein (DUF885 family)
MPIDPLPGPTPAVPPAPAALAALAVDPVRAFRAQLDADWQYWMHEYPEWATQLGYPGHNARWTDYRPEAMAARAAYLRASLARIQLVDGASLPDADRLSYDLYRDQLETAVRGLDVHYDAMPARGVVPHHLLMPVNQLEGVLQDIPLVVSMMPAVTARDYETLVERLERVPDLIEQTMALMRRGMEAGLTPPRITLRDVPAQAAAQLVDDPLTSPLLAAFQRMPSSIPAPVCARLTAAAVAAFESCVRPAFAAFHAFLTLHYLPACRETTAISALPGGEDAYAYNVRWHTTLSRSPEEIHEIGRAELVRIRAEMDRVQAATGFTGTFQELAHWLRTDPRFYFRDAGELLAEYRDIAKRADPALAPLFRRLPRTPYGIDAVPGATAASQTSAYYQPGAFAAGRAAMMFANTSKIESRPRWEMTALTLHEAVPGHHLQIALAQELYGLPDFRRHSNYTAFVEGWALYAEHLGDEMGMYADPYAKYGQLTYELWRALRLVVDTGLHVMGWTRDEAIRFFAAETPKAAEDIVVEVDRYIVWPGQALGYKTGEIEIRRLRAEAERALGEAFDIRAFHDVVLGEGAVPLDVLAGRVRTWIDERLTAVGRESIE